jgi:hypothetical protein
LLSFHTIFRFAPPLFEHSVLDAALSFIKSMRQLSKHENGYLHAAVAAIEREELARLLWNQIEREPGISQRNLCASVHTDSKSVTQIIEIWWEFGLIVREAAHGSANLTLKTRMNDDTDGMCPSCGVRGKGRKELFLRSIVCRRCGSEVYYHIANATTEQA